MNLSHRPWLTLVRTTFSLSLSLGLLACATPQRQPVVVNLVAINDFHGHLDQEKFSLTRAADPKPVQVEGGGIEVLGSYLQAWRKEDKDLVFVGGGDLIGASPGISSLFADEPTLQGLGRLGLRVSALGNHEFDHGIQELQRQIKGGCDSPRPDRACKFDGDFKGAQFSYIAANVMGKLSGQPFFPAYHIEQVKGVKIGFIGAVLRDTPMMVASEKLKDVSFIDEAEAINRTIPGLKAAGVTVFVVLIHEGGTTTEAFDQPACSQLKGPIVNIVKRLDPAIKLIVSGHSHTGFMCQVDGRTVTQAQMYGHLLTRIALTLDGNSHEVMQIDTKNVEMTPSQLAVPAELSTLMEQARKGSDAMINQPVARLAVSTLSRKLNEAGESPMGNVVADAQLAAVKNLGAQIAFMNNKGIRGNLETKQDNISTYGQNSTVLPFGNTLVLMTLTGAQIRTLLEQQMWLDDESPDGRNVLQVSDGFSYTWDRKRPVGKRVLAETVKLNGVAIDDQAEYRIVANNFIAGGGDRLPMFVEGKNKVDTGLKDIDVFMQYIKAKDHAGTPVGSSNPAGRVQRLN
ncbi:bifunctional metallophosphatase/5'-nucleotidase [Undibacterium flavidum]|uniref:Bifunctional metallophosphatase/5'-nucleotidase n=1 Tax=Undibacterium flavidum TaxID=2762297 RepID=A0ABR6Y9N4_9BURK|nr:bifunctional metallophosphatase/5'-nucleotidase [Undibacterium flavidum]MBC3873340.1 bifunctional metallophosphatase/5'-nucleotidase [Undibacterium flavidum]